MRKTEYLRATEFVSELEAVYLAVRTSTLDEQAKLVEQGTSRTDPKYRDLENSIAAYGETLERLNHVRAVIKDAMARTGARYATRGGS